MAEPVAAVEVVEEYFSGSSEGDVLNLNSDDGWEDAEPEEETDVFISLLDDEVFTDIMHMVNYCKEKHNFDFLDLRNRFALDFYGSVKLVNFIRAQVHSGELVSSSTISREDFEDERFLKPVLEHDALLFNLDELPELQDSSEPAKGKEIVANSAYLDARILELEEELQKIQSQFDDYRVTVKQTLDERWNDKSAPTSAYGQAEKEEKRDDDTHYFSSYSYNGKSWTPYLALISDGRRYSRNNVKRHHPNGRLSRLYLQQ